MTLMSSLTTILPPIRLFPSSSSIPLKQDNFSDGEGEEEEEERGGRRCVCVCEGGTLLIKHLRLIVMKCHP